MVIQMNLETWGSTKSGLGYYEKMPCGSKRPKVVGSSTRMPGPSCKEPVERKVPDIYLYLWKIIKNNCGSITW